MFVKFDSDTELKPVQEIDYNELATLRRFALEGALEREIDTSCSQLAEDLTISRQTVSRRLQQLDEAGMIHRTIVATGQRITISRRGEKLLREEYEQYARIFDSYDGIRLEGEVRPVDGRGPDPWSMAEQNPHVETYLGYEPFDEPLSIELLDDSVWRRNRIEAVVTPKWINGNHGDDGTVGAVAVYPVSVVDSIGNELRPAHIVSTDEMESPDVLQVIGPSDARDVVARRTGTEVTIHVDG